MTSFLSSIHEKLAFAWGPRQVGDTDDSQGDLVADPVAGTEETSFLSILRVGEFRNLWFAHALLVLGESMKMLALSALVYERTRSPLLASIAYLCSFLPQAVGSSVFLAFADRLGRRALLVGWDLIRAAAAAVLATGLLPVPAMLALVMLVGLFDPVPAAAKLALLPDVLDARSFVLGRSLFNITVGVTQIAGYAVGGALLVAIGPLAAFWGTAALAVVSALILRFGLRVHPSRLDGPAAKSRVAHGIIASLRGNRTLLADPLIRGLLFAQWFPAGWIVGAEALMVSYAAEIGHPGALGAFLTAAAAGMLIGDVAVGRFARQRARNRWALPLAVLLGLPYLLFVLKPGVLMAAALAVLASVGFGYNLCLQAPFVEVVPPQMRGHALGLAGAGLMSWQGIAAALVGALAEVISPAQAMAVAAACSLLTTLAVVRWLRPRTLTGITGTHGG